MVPQSEMAMAQQHMNMGHAMYIPNSVGGMAIDPQQLAQLQHAQQSHMARMQQQYVTPVSACALDQCCFCLVRGGAIVFDRHSVCLFAAAVSFIEGRELSSNEFPT